MKRNYLILKGFTILFFLLFELISDAYSQNKDISGGYIFEGEPYLAIDPVNSQHMVVEWMGFEVGHGLNLSMKTKATFDGGKTWSGNVTLPHQSPTFKSADPSMVFDKKGNVIACYIDYRENPDSGGVYIIKSTNGGISWSGASMVINVLADGTKYPLDRPWLAIDNSNGPYNGNMYVTTKPAPWVPAPNRPYFMRSTDGGKSWTPFRYLDAPAYLVGNFIQQPMAFPAVASNGNLHIIYPSWVTTQNILPGYYLASSSDGGNTFIYKPSIFMKTNGSADTLPKAGYHLFCDPSDAKHIAFILPINLYGDIDVFFIESKDNGDTWTNPLRINDDEKGNGKMQDLVWGDFNSHGDLVLTWRDRRKGGGTGYENPSEIWGAVRWKDSIHFSKNFRISDTLTAYNSVLSQNGNDFMTVCLFQDTIAAVWGDVRNGKLNIWFDKRNIKTNISSGIHKIVTEKIPEVNLFPNPSGDYIQIEGEGIKEIIIYDMSGREVLRQSNLKINISMLKAGGYNVLIKTKFGNAERKFIKK